MYPSRTLRTVILVILALAPLSGFAQAPALTVVRPFSAREGSSGSSAWIEIPAALATDLDVTIVSSDPAQATVTPSVTIPAGQKQVDYTITAVDDALQDGTAQVAFTFSAAGYSDATVLVPIEDNEIHHLELTPIASPQVRNAPIALTIMARAIDGALVSNFHGPVNFTATGGDGPVPMTPVTPAAFERGVWRGNISIGADTEDVVVNAQAADVSAVTNAFAVARGPLARFGWSSIPSPQTMDQPFPVTIRAEDAGGNLIEEFDGSAGLSAVMEEIHVAAPTGLSSPESDVLGAMYASGRMQVLYTPAEIGSAGLLTAVEVFYLQGYASKTLPNFTIRVKAVGPVAPTTWDNDGWTIVFQSSPHVLSGTWAKFPFSTPIPYDGKSNLLIDFSYRHEDRGFHSALSYSTLNVSGRGVSYDDIDVDDPLAWSSGASPRFSISGIPLLRFTREVSESPIRPAATAFFVGGMWSGDASLPVRLSPVRLRAREAGGRLGDSSLIASQVAPDAPGTEPIYRETFENTPLPNTWFFTGQGYPRTSTASADQPHQSDRCLLMEAELSPSRNEATWTVNLAGLKGLTLKYWAKRYSPSVSGAPTIPFFTGANFDGVAISTNGSTWYEVQGMRNLTGSWAQYSVDLDRAVAERGLAYTSTFRIRFNRYGSGLAPAGGIAVDDIEIVAVPPSMALQLEVPAQLGEGGVPQRATVRVPFAPPEDLVVTLANLAPAKLAMPAQIVIPAGHFAGHFQIAPIDDLLADGNKVVGVSASAPGLYPASAVISVMDDDFSAIALSVPSLQTVEGAPPLNAAVLIEPPLPAPLLLTVTTSDATAITVPATLAVPAGAASVPLPLAIVNDTKLDGPQTATITISGPAGILDAKTIAVEDNETTELKLASSATPPLASVAEGSGAFQLVATLPATFPAATTLTLSSSAPSKIVPANPTIQIPAGSTTANIMFNAIEDSVSDGPQAVTLTVSAPGLQSAQYTLTFLDDETDHFAFSPIASPQVRGAPFPVTITARDLAGNVVEGFQGSIALAAGGRAIVPAAITFARGVWSGEVQIQEFAEDVILQTSAAGGGAGASNSFDVTLGEFTALRWGAIPPAQAPGRAIPVTVEAVDAGGNALEAVNEPIAVRALVPVTVATVGAGTGTDSSGFLASTHRARAEVIYLASELGAAKPLDGISLNVRSGAQGQVLSNWTIRVKPTTRQALTTAAGWDGDGWTVVHQSNAAVTANGWIRFLFDRPYDYDGESHLLVDFSYNGTVAVSPSLQWQVDFAGTGRVLRGSNSTGSDPLTWSGNNHSGFLSSGVPHTRFHALSPTPALVPADPGITAGAWSGHVTLLAAGGDFMLEASDAGGRRGLSNSFALAGPGALLPTPPFVDGFDVLGFSSAWAISPAGAGGPRVTTDYSPRTGPSHALLGGSLFPRRHELTLAIDLAGFSGMTLSFWAKRFGSLDHGPPPSPFIGGADFDGVAVSADGTNWHEILPLRGMTAGQWTHFTVDLDAAIAARALSYNSAFRIRFNQYCTGTMPNDGLVIDDVSLTGTPVARLQMSLPAAIGENAPPAIGTVSMHSTAAIPRTVTLSSTNPEALAIPESVTIPAGATSAVFALTPIDNGLSADDVVVGITAEASGWHPAAALVQVLDDETSTWWLSIPSPLTEGAGTINAILHHSPPAAGQVTVQLQSSLPAVLQVPTSVLVPAGEAGVVFPIVIPNDSFITGPRTVTVTATPAGEPAITAQVTVQDNDSRALSMASGEFVESETRNWSVQVQGTNSSDLVVSLVSSDPATLSVPASVTIPGGQTSVNFTINLPHNPLPEGTKVVTITASAPSFESVEKVFEVRDKDAGQYLISPIAGPVIRGVPFTVTVNARDIAGISMPYHAGTVSISAFDDAGPLPVTPPSADLTFGKWTGTVTVNSFSSSARIAVSNTSGSSGTSAPFTVGRGPAVRYEWSGIPQVVEAGQPFTATVTAIDAGENVATSHSGYVSFEETGARVERAIGSGQSTTTSYPLHNSAHDGRTQVIYLAGELGGSASFDALSLHVSGHTPFANWTIRMKHTTRTSFSPEAWEADGWTTVHESNGSGFQNGWVKFPFATPFAYDGTSNLMVDFSFDKVAPVMASQVRIYGNSISRTYRGASNSQHGTPLGWSGGTPSGSTGIGVPQVRLGVSTPIRPVAPAVGFLTNGVWTGRVWMPAARTNTSLIATDFSGRMGTSVVFAVQAAPDGDADALPDFWETEHALSPGPANDGDLPLGDPDWDGIANLLEYAFDLNPREASHAGLPVPTTRINPADGKRYLELTYRRRIAAPGLRYLVEATGDSMVWNSGPAFTELVSVLPPAANDHMEEVTVRILPAIGTPGVPSRSARVRIEAP